MAAVARRVATVRSLVERLGCSPLRTTFPAASRSFTGSAGGSSEERSVAHRSDDAPVSRRSRRGGDLFPGFFGDVAFDPFNPRRSLSDVFNIVDQMMDLPFGTASGGIRRGWDVREDDNALYMKIDMPGLGKDDVDVKVDQNTLVIRGEASEEESEEGDVEGGGDEEERPRRRYSTRLDLPANQYDVKGIRAEMKNGVLKVVVPKVKEEERQDVHHVQIQ